MFAVQITSQELCTGISHGYCIMLWFSHLSGFYSYSSGLLHWHWGNKIAPVPVKQPWRIWVSRSQESTWNSWYIHNKRKHNKKHILEYIFYFCFKELTHLPLNKMATISQTIFTDAYSSCILIKISFLFQGVNSSPPNKMATISQTVFSDAYSWMKRFLFWLKFHWSLFLRVQLTITQHWLRLWLYGPCMIVPHKWTEICWLATAN